MFSALLFHVGAREPSMQLKSLHTVLFALLGFAGACAGGPPCSGSQVICARNIRPYSDNAYTWKNICGFTADPNALIAQDVEKWDPDPGWYVYRDDLESS